MSSKNALLKTVPGCAEKTTPKNPQSEISCIQMSTPKPKLQETNLKRDIKQCLKLLECGDVHLIDFKEIGKEFLQKPHLGDHLQYELHNYCKKDPDMQTDVSIVVKLAKLCYSNISVSGFSDMVRFVGCVYFISSYLLKKEKYKSALEVSCSLTVKKEVIMKLSKENSAIRNFIYSLHNSFMLSAIALATKVTAISDKNYKTSHELAVQSLKFFQLTNVEEFSPGTKLLNTSRLYLYSLKHYNDEDISYFFKTLKAALKSLLPNFSDYKYLYFFLHKLNPVKNLDLSKGCEIQSQLSRIFNLVTVMVGFSSGIKDSLHRILDFFFCSSSKVSFDEEIFNDLQPSDSNRELCFIILSIVFNYGIQFWWKAFENNWFERVSTDLVQKLFEKFIQFHNSNCRTVTLYCTSVQSPCKTCYADLLSGNLQKIQYTIRLCLKAQVPESLFLVSLSRKAFKLSMECVNEMKERGCCKFQRSYAWKHSVIHHTNAIEDILRQATSDEWWLHLRDCSEEVLRAIVGSEFDLPYDFKRVAILFQRWHFANLKLKYFHEALYVCAAFYVSYPAEETEIMAMWMQTKSEAGNEIFEEISVTEFLNSYDKVLVDFNSKYHNSNIDLKSVLMMELKAYGFCSSDGFENPKTPHKLVSRLWKQLVKLSPNVWETSLGLTCLISTIIFEDDKKLPENIQKKCDRIIAELLNWQRKGYPQCRSLLHAANLTFFLFLDKMKVAENSDGKMNPSSQVLDNLKKAEEEKIKFGEDVDLNLTCNLIPSSSHLTVDLETNYLDSLERIVDLWTAALDSGSEDLPTLPEMEVCLKAVKHVAQLYKLFGEYHRSFTTWLLFYKIARFFNNSVAMLLGLSHLMENLLDVETSDLTKEAEVIAGKICLETKEKNVLVEYWMTVASNHLKNQRPDKCLEYLCKTRNVLESLRANLSTQAHKAKFWCLVSQFLCVYPDHEVAFDYSVGTDFRVMVFKAFTYANNGARNDLIRSASQTECVEMALAMIEVNLWAYHFHRIYRKTDYMRFFLDDLYQIVQKLFLPTRTAEMLVRLAEADMICGKRTDCQEKIARLRSILTTLPSKFDQDFKLEEPESKSPCLVVPKERNFEKLAPRAISPSRFRDQLDAGEADPSPVRFLLRRPKFLDGRSHAPKCKCRPCQNILIQILTMDALALEAEISWKEKASLENAASSFVQALDVLEKIELLRAEQSQVLRLQLRDTFQSEPGELDFQTKDIQFYSARLLIKQSFFELYSKNTWTERVGQAMERVDRMMEAFSFEQKLLMWTFAELKLCAFELSGRRKIERQKSSPPLEYKTSACTKTPFISRSNNEICSEVKTNSQCEATIVGKGKKAAEKRNEKSAGVKKVGDTAKKSKIRPKKLSFQTNELSIPNRTSVKTITASHSAMKPRKLILEEDEEEEKEKSSTSRAPVGKSSALQTLRPAIEIHVDSTRTQRRGKKGGEDNRNQKPQKGARAEKSRRKVQDYSVDLFEA